MVERILGKAEVRSSILRGGTRKTSKINLLHGAEKRIESSQNGTEREVYGQKRAKSVQAVLGVFRLDAGSWDLRCHDIAGPFRGRSVVGRFAAAVSPRTQDTLWCQSDFDPAQSLSQISIEADGEN